MNLKVLFYLLMPLLSVYGCASTKKEFDQRSVTFAVAPHLNQIVFSANGAGGSDLYLLQLDSLAVQSIMNSPEYEVSPAFAPDGKQIAYVASTPSTSDCSYIYTSQLNGAGRRQLTRGTANYDGQPCYSRDGKQIVFARASQRRQYGMGGWTLDKWDVFAMNADGSNLRRITKGNYYGLYSPQFSADGREVVYSAEKANSSTLSIYKVPVAGTAGPKQLTIGNRSSSPSHSPGRQKIVFFSDRDIAYDYEIWVMNSDGANQRQITKNRSYNQSPRYGPDGIDIYFLSDPKRNKRRELWKVREDGTGSRLVADSSLFDSPLTWKPRTLPPAGR